MNEVRKMPPHARFVLMDNYGNVTEYPPNISGEQALEILYKMSAARSMRLLVYELAGVYHAGAAEWASDD